MDEIYRLVGKAMHIYQNLEQCLSLTVFKAMNKFPNDSTEYKRIEKMFLTMHDLSLGNKLQNLKEIDMFSNEDNLVLDYIKNNRNYIAHHYFVDNNFDTERDIQERKKELTRILSDAKFIENVIKSFVCKL